ncbi:MAG TPA: AmmeMemoRadiSam system protein B [Candidatus Acidoferrales bacterium]|nr:AmmeMemoRadiSam system protein B [Candidatus Acidoferrales bacterium]
MKLRQPCVADAFYAGTKTELNKQITECFTHQFGPGSIPQPNPAGPRKIVGIVSPHAGYMYSGPVATNGYSKLALDGKPDVFIILGPNHTGMGSGLSIQTEGAWQTPIGTAEIDTALAKRIQKSTDIIDVDEAAHVNEHSIEVQLPFLQFVYKDTIKFVPICMMMQDLTTCREVARSIFQETADSNAAVIASSDFTHYESHEAASRKDRGAIDAILRLDEEQVNELGETSRVTMCGYGPITTLVVLSKLIKGVRPELLAYRTSGDVTGDKSAVVGYSSITFTRQ